MSAITLYHYWRSSCSWRVRWALHIKQIPHQLKHINLLAGEQHMDAYKKINPSASVPSLEVSGKFFGESLGIIEWLDETYPANPLLPLDPVSRMYVRQLSYTIACGTQPLQNLVAQKYYSSKKDEQEEYVRYWIARGLTAYEKILENGPYGSFSCGGEVTMADLCLIPQCYNADRYLVDLNNFPILKGIYERALKTEACEKAAPHHFIPK